MGRFLDMLWPTLEEWAPYELAEQREENRDDVEAIQRVSWSARPELALEEARRLERYEEDRRRTSEAKASTFLLFAGALVPILTYFESSVWEGKTGTAPQWLTLPTLGLAVGYLLGAGFWAFRAISVGVDHQVGVGDLVRIWSAADNPMTDLIRETLTAARRNRDGVNHKVRRSRWHINSWSELSSRSEQ